MLSFQKASVNIYFYQLQKGYRARHRAGVERKLINVHYKVSFLGIKKELSLKRSQLMMGMCLQMVSSLVVSNKSKYSARSERNICSVAQASKEAMKLAITSLLALALFALSASALPGEAVPAAPGGTASHRPKQCICSKYLGAEACYCQDGITRCECSTISTA